MFIFDRIDEAVMKFGDVLRHTDQEIDQFLRELKQFHYDQEVLPKLPQFQEEYYGQKIAENLEFVVLKLHPSSQDPHVQIEDQMYEMELSKKFWETMQHKGEDFCYTRNRDFDPEAQKRCEDKWVELLTMKLEKKVEHLQGKLEQAQEKEKEFAAAKQKEEKDINNYTQAINNYKKAIHKL